MAPPELEPMQAAQIRELLSQPVPWDRFIDLVRLHAVASIVLDRLEKFGEDLVPQPVLASFKRLAFTNWGQAVVLAHELEGLLDRFQESGIQAAPLKGNVLSSRLFGEPALRHVSDIDLLVRGDDLSVAHDLMLAAGYRRTTPSRDLTPKQSAVFLRHSHHFTYRREQPAVSVELHWRVFRWSEEETRVLWERMLPYDWMGRTVLQPDDALLLLILCDHGSQHRYSHLKWLADIVTLLCSGDLDCSELMLLARHLDLELPLAQTVLLISRVYPNTVALASRSEAPSSFWFVEATIHAGGTPAPQCLLAFAQTQPGAQRLADEAYRCLVDSDEKPVAPDRRLSGLRNMPYWLRRSAALAWYSAHLRKRRPLGTRLLPVAIGLSDFEAFPLPDRLFWMYYAFRPAFWAIRFIRGR